MNNIISAQTCMDSSASVNLIPEITTEGETKSFAVKIGGIPIKLEHLTPEDMPNENFRDIAELCGMDVACKLLVCFQGNIIQVPTRGFINIEKKIILSEFNGTAQSIKILARRLGVSEKYIRSVLKKAKINNIPVDGQISFPFIKN